MPARLHRLSTRFCLLCLSTYDEPTCVTSLLREYPRLVKDAALISDILCEAQCIKSPHLATFLAAFVATLTMADTFWRRSNPATVAG